MKKIKQKAPLCVFSIKGMNCVESSYGGARGLCQNHYVSARYHVLKGHTTWEELEEKGLAIKKISQAEKNMNQMHPHRTYNVKKVKPNPDF